MDEKFGRESEIAGNQKMKNAKFTKKNLPSKICENCEREMKWRKRWEKVWDEVKFCSDKCRKNSKTHAKT